MAKQDGFRARESNMQGTMTDPYQFTIRDNQDHAASRQSRGPPASQH